MHFLPKLLNVLLPDTCVLCGQPQATRNDHLLCHFCWAALPRNINCCRHCAQPLQAPGVCGLCQDPHAQPGICVAPLLHEAEARYLVHQLKFENGFRAGRVLAEIMRDAIERAYAFDPLPGCIVPVPLSYRRQFQRGYNQAAWLTHGINRHVRLPICYGPITRRHGPPQYTLTRRKRARLAGSTFRLDLPVPHPHVAIVDDVLTTGATTRVLGALLKRQGATRIDIWCATRAVMS